MKPVSSKPLRDPSHDVYRSEGHPLDAIFSPGSVAVVGATERAGSVGRSVLWNLLSSPFGGTVYPVSLKHSSVLGIKAYPRLASVPEQVDLAIIVTPAPTVPALIDECLVAGVRGVIVISAGFKEHGAEGIELERQIKEKLRGQRMRL
ncbi:MAG TPA: CoA-binding protein, partial [Terriglobales bacterium]|nr:CoA-binding protein [Terriglobales bacterium]